MAFLTQGNSIRDIKPQFRMGRKGLDMVSMQVSSLAIATMLTGEFVTQVHVISPSLVGISNPFTAALCYFSVAITMAVRAFWSSFPNYPAYFGASINGMHLSKPIARPCLSRIAHFCKRRLGMPLTFERRHAPTQSSVWGWGVSANITNSRQAITAALIPVKQALIAPFLALCTSFKAGSTAGDVLIHSNTSFFRCDPQCTFWSLCHG
jgi:hypothetical protein